ncbi:MAG: SHD1 domain-containing protein, partial [Patescibacteria group bacterium]|nr:SHD1 domain-containing protein [Patescibacteria group bacterium]
MNRYRMLLLSVALLGFTGQGVARTWTDTTGTYRIEAEFVDVVEGKVHLKRADGSVIAVPLDKLSDADRDHIKRLLAESLKTMPQPSLMPGPMPGLTPGGESLPVPVEPAAAQTPAAEPAAEMPPAEMPAAAKAAAVKAAARTGRFSTSFTEHSPMAARSAVFPRMVQPRDMNATIGEYQKQLGPAFNSEYFHKPEDETWQVVVPDDYDGSIPYGLFVFVNSSDSGGPQGNWLPVLQKYRLIYIGPDNAGNEKDVLLRRAPMALDAVHNISRDYAIDPARVYISGNSGGGRLASRVAMAFPDVFTGGQYHVGADEYSTTAVGSMG